MQQPAALIKEKEANTIPLSSPEHPSQSHHLSSAKNPLP